MNIQSIIDKIGEETKTWTPVQLRELFWAIEDHFKDKKIVIEIREHADHNRYDHLGQLLEEE